MWGEGAYGQTTFVKKVFQVRKMISRKTEIKLIGNQNGGELQKQTVSVTFSGLNCQGTELTRSREERMKTKTYIIKRER